MIVIFDSNGGECAVCRKSVEPGAPYGELPIPNRAGYIFLGWWPERDGDSEQYVREKTVSVGYDHTLYAHWAKPVFIKSAAGNLYLNIYGEHLTALRNGMKIVLWSKDVTAAEQRFLIADTKYAHCVLSCVDPRYGLNILRVGSPYRCTIHTVYQNESDAVCLFEACDAGGFRIRLRNRAVYLTAASEKKGANVFWSEEKSDVRSVWCFEAAEPSAVEQYAYPTETRSLSQAFSAGHPGLDLPARIGEPVYAFADGVTAFVQNCPIRWSAASPKPPFSKNAMQTMGNCIAINHENPDGAKANGSYARSIYMHLRDAPLVRIGETVKRGQLLGYIGDTGRTSGAHLHFALAVGNQAGLKPGEIGWLSINRTLHMVDPLLYLSQYH